MLLLLQLLVEQAVLQLLIFQLQVAERLLLAGFFRSLAFTGHLLGQGVDARDLGGGIIGVGWVGWRWLRNVEGLHPFRVFRLSLAIVDPPVGVGPLINLLLGGHGGGRGQQNDSTQRKDQRFTVHRSAPMS
nr:hypothetical protein [Candidatus Competibacter phosphatis]